MRQVTVHGPILLLLFGCGTETGNGLVTIKAGLSSSSVPSMMGSSRPSGKDAQGTAFAIESARASIRHIEFQRPGGKATCEDLPASNNERVKCDGGKIRVGGPFVLDLIREEASPSLADLAIPAGTYKRVDVRFDVSKASDGLVPANDELAGSTLIASGTFSYRDRATMFDLALEFTEDARFEDAEGIDVEEGKAGDVLLRLDVARWFGALPVTECIDEGDLEITAGALSIEDKGGACSDIENTLKEAIKNSGQLAAGKK